ncbi:MAG TPA: iron chelate uptake ABC transporter family permease subunit [Polyangia bacterium]|nr:iron chelate uptake ABC transporter family permease subunit [Polyangia bacterium]
MTHLLELRWMLPPLVMCLVLTGIHGYLGIHVLSRKVIFVDLALAQIAALGTTYALLLGYDPRLPGDSVVVYFFSLGFTFVGAAVFSLTRMRHEKVPQEAFIGIMYATASAVSLLLLAKAAGESEHIKEMLVGNVLLVTWPTIGKTAIIYALIGAFHWIWRRPLIEISTDPEAALARGRRVRLWDFLFYASFGFVITSSVAVAGVLLVFSFLVVPAVIAFMYQVRTAPRIVLAWTVGTACSAAGMILSYYGDLPTGPSVVSCFAGILVLASVVYYIRNAAHRRRAAGRVIGVAAVVGLLFFVSTFARKGQVAHAHGGAFDTLVAALESDDEGAQIEALHHLAEMKDPHVVPYLVRTLEHTTSDRVTEHVLQVLPGFGDAALGAVPVLQQAAQRRDDPFLRLEAAAAILRLRDPSGFAAVITVLSDDPPLLVDQKAGQLLKEMTGNDFGVGQTDDAPERARARERLQSWLAEKGGRPRWRQDLRRFE